jgi:LacI family gluconate utilization system Gnt-I transcriptional repressor
MLGQSGYENSREDALLEAIIGRRPDGVVLTGIMRSAEARKRLLASGIPVVETWDLTPTPIDMLVGFSHEAIGREVARYLHARGRRKAVVGGRDERSQRRMNAFAQECAALGMQKAGRGPHASRCRPDDTGARPPGIGRTAAAQPDLDAIFCSSDLLALGVMIEAQSRGIAIPGQLAVVGFGDLEFSRDLQPRLTTVRIDGTGIGQRAARFIIDRASGIEVRERIVDVGFSIVARDSAYFSFLPCAS